MKATQAWAWLAAGVVALGLNGFYQDGGMAWAHRMVEQVRGEIAGRSALVADLATGHFDRFLMRANLAATRHETQSCRLNPKIVRVDTGMVRMDYGFAKFESFVNVPEVCTRVRVNVPEVRVNIPRISVPRSVVNVQVPMVHVEIPGEGPI